MTFKIVNKKQSIYILIVTLLIASISFLTIHGINIAVSSTPNNPPKLDVINPDTVIRTGPLENTPTSLSTVISPNQDTASSAMQLPQAADVNCKVGGCNHELCLGINDNDTVSSCNNTEANKCFIGGSCTIQQGTQKCGWTPNATMTRCIADSNFATQDLRVMELMFISDPNNIPYQPADLSAELQADIKEASTYHKYKDSLAKPAIQVKVVDSMTFNHGRENVENYWYGSYYKMIQDLGLCQKIQDEKIDQIWMWVDPRDMTSGPGLEYALSSKYLLRDGDPGVASPPFCEGRFSFTIMGFDYTRLTEEAFHSFGHFMEGVVGGFQGDDLFGSKYVGAFDSGTQSRVACGNVHFPPNGRIDYDYSNPAIRSTYCQNWNPQGTGALQSLNCSTWGCTQDGYLAWWFQNMPGFNNTLNYQSRKLPPWWDFIVDMDTKVHKYNPDLAYYMDNAQIDPNDTDLNSNCSCSGSAATTNECWKSELDGSNICYQCAGTHFYQVPQFFCNP
ncbi:MAG: hypothetical protein ACMG57_04965 [Candidatus Dojkabacteria bacterium]